MQRSPEKRIRYYRRQGKSLEWIKSYKRGWYAVGRAIKGYTE